MTKLIIILSFVAMFAGACLTAKEPVEMKLVKVRFIKIDTTTRWINGSFIQERKYLYKGENGIEYSLEVSLIDNTLFVKR